MCGRYTIFTSEENREINEIINEVSQRHHEENMKTGEIFPTNQVPVFIAKQEKVVPDLLAWGFPNFRNKGVIINARSETAAEKKMFRDSLFTRRCVIVSTGFYEWSHDGKKQKYLFTLPQTKTLYMAGLYHEFKSEKRFVILTTNANSSISDIHDRMPVIVTKDRIHDWIYDLDTAMGILHSVPPILDRAAVER